MGTEKEDLVICILHVAGFLLGPVGNHSPNAYPGLFVLLDRGLPSLISNEQSLLYIKIPFFVSHIFLCLLSLYEIWMSSNARVKLPQLFLDLNSIRSFKRASQLRPLQFSTYPRPDRFITKTSIIHNTTHIPAERS